MVKFCPHCGNPVENGIKICPVCGTCVEQNEQEQDTIVQHIDHQTADESSAGFFHQKKILIVIVVAVLILCGSVGIGVYMYIQNLHTNIIKAQDKQNKAEKEAQYAKQKETDAEKQIKITQYVLKNYINLKNQYNSEIASLAEAVNAHVAKYDNFRADEGLIARAQGLESRIIATQNDVSRATIPNQTVKSKLIEVLGLEATRAHGLYVGMRASQHGGSYSPGFQSGTAAAYKFDDANAELTNLLQ